MVIKKISSALLALIFFIFAGVQYNDPDGWIWILAYLAPAIFFILVPFGIELPRYARIAFWIAIMCMLLYIPDIIQWTKDGCPSIIESMKAETKYVELVREFLGLLIISVSLFFYPKLLEK